MSCRKAPSSVVPLLLAHLGGLHYSEGWGDLVGTGQTGFASLMDDFQDQENLGVRCCDLVQISTI